MTLASYRVENCCLDLLGYARTRFITTCTAMTYGVLASLVR